MKKTLTINLSGFVFHIEEDAYELLENYIKSIRQYFANYEGSKEIIEDIESRIAERFFEIRETQKTEAINQIHVEELIKSLGTVADFKEYEQSEQSEQSKQSGPSKQSEQGKKVFRRDLSRKKLGGVASGLANYLEVDPLWVRLLLVIGFFGLIPLLHIGNVIFWGYIICWIAIPGEYPNDSNMGYKRFFRDPDNKVIGGVISGIAKFTGWDLGLLRVLAVISILVFGTGFLAYLIILIITPEAKTLTDKMSMEGEPITLENIEHNINKSIDSDNKTESFFGKILLIPFRVFAAILPAFKGFFNVIRWIVQYFAGALLMIIALALMIVLFFAFSASLSGTNYFNAIQLGGELIPFLLFQDLPKWSIWAFVFAFLPIIVATGIGGASLLANKRFYNKTFSYVSTIMAVIGWIGLFYVGASLGNNFSRTASTNKTQLYAMTDSSFVFDIHHESQSSMVEKLLGDHALANEFLDEDERHDFNRGGFNRANITFEGYNGDSLQIIQFFKSNGKTRIEAEQNAQSVTYQIVNNLRGMTFDSHFGLKNYKFRNQRLKVKVLIPYGKVFSMSKELGYFIENMIPSEYFEEDESTFKTAKWIMDPNIGLRCINRIAVPQTENDMGNQDDWEDFEKRFEEKDKSDATIQ